jgi:hypothetical protein
MSNTGATAPSSSTDGPSLAQENPLAFIGAAFAAGVVSRTVIKGMGATWRVARKGRRA